jgi:hypothetical protein
MILKKDGEECVTMANPHKSTMTFRPESLNAIDRKTVGSKESHGRLESSWAWRMSKMPALGTRP